jgi:hypothetical protein
VGGDIKRQVRISLLRGISGCSATLNERLDVERDDGRTVCEGSVGDEGPARVYGLLHLQSDRVVPSFVWKRVRGRCLREGQRR